MAFTLRINFSGLCMFVPQPVNGLMHVLLPKSTAHAHGADRHVPVLWFDMAHLRPGVTGGDNIPVLVRLAGETLRLNGTGAANLYICTEIVNLRPVTGKPVHADHLGKDERQKLAARITLGSGRMTRIAPGDCWEWVPGQFRHLAHQVEWEIEYPDASLTLQMEDFDGVPGRTLQTLYPFTPLGGTPVINLNVHHVPVGDLPPDPEPASQRHVPAFGAEPTHFLTFYTLFGGGVPIRLPKYWGSGSDCERTSACLPVLDMGGSPFNCMVAGDWG